MGIPVILVIEDNFADVTLLRLALDELGTAYRLEILRDGEAALLYVADHRAGRREAVPCVILLDLHLPKYSGVEVLHSIRQEPILTDVHVMVLTSLADPRQQVDIRASGALLRLKPSNLEGFLLLAAEIMEICKNSTISRPEASIA
jgi:CheY-like chemotaxis protein